MVADTGILTQVLNQILEVFHFGSAAVSAHALGLLTKLACLELTMAALWWALTGHDAIVGFVRRILMIGLFLAIIENYDWLIHLVSEGFIQTGKDAGGKNLSFVRDPSTIVAAGFVVAMPIFDHLSTYSGTAVLTHLHDIIISAICALLVVGAYFTIAIQIFVTYLEFTIVSTLGLIFVPFGVLRPTAFMAEKLFGAIMSFGVKLMVLGFLVSVMVPIMKSFTLQGAPDWKPLLNLVGACIAVAALAWHAPGVAASLLTGAPTLTAASAGATTVAGAAHAAMLPHIADKSIATITNSAASATKSAAMLGASTLAVAHAAGAVSAARLKTAGHSKPIQIGGAIIGAGLEVARQSAQSAKQPVERLKDSLKQVFAAKQLSVKGFASLAKENASQESSKKKDVEK